MTIKSIFERGNFYVGASGIKMLNVYKNKIPKNKKIPKLNKSVYGVDSVGDSGSE